MKKKKKKKNLPDMPTLPELTTVATSGTVPLIYTVAFEGVPTVYIRDIAVIDISNSSLGSTVPSSVADTVTGAMPFAGTFTVVVVSE